MLNISSMLKIIRAIDWLQILGHLFCILFWQSIIGLTIAFSMISLNLIQDENNIPWFLEPISSVIMISMYVFFFYRSACLAKMNQLTHVFLVATAVFIFFIVFGYFVHDNKWHEYIPDIPFFYGTMLAGYGIWRVRQRRQHTRIEQA